MGMECVPIGSLQAGYREEAGYGVEEGKITGGHRVLVRSFFMFP
jgi:hypothetical protein